MLDAAITGEVELVISAYILEELDHTLTKPYFAERVSSTGRETYLARLRAVAILVAPPGAVSGVVTDPRMTLSSTPP